ncbi:MAG: hypothetical protein H6727_17815 [Myxococcales bacterium]|nr:hypothetical protein [Myxococcales bacterium]
MRSFVVLVFFCAFSLYLSCPALALEPRSAAGRPPQCDGQLPEIPCSTVLQNYQDSLSQIERWIAPRSTWKDHLIALRRVEKEFPSCFASRQGLSMIERRKKIDLRYQQTVLKDQRKKNGNLKKTKNSPKSYGYRSSVEMNLKRSRFWWSVELGAFMHFYMPMGQLNQLPAGIRPFNFTGFLLGGRWGYAGNGFLITGDLFYATGAESFMVQFGATFGYMFNPYFTFEAGTGLNIIGAQGLDKPEIHIPLEIGFTLRFNFRTTSLGLRLVSGTAYDVDQNALATSVRVNLVVSSL